MASTPSPAQNKPLSQTTASQQTQSAAQQQTPAGQQKGKNAGEWAESVVFFKILLNGSLPILVSTPGNKRRFNLVLPRAEVPVSRIYLARRNSIVEYQLWGGRYARCSCGPVEVSERNTSSLYFREDQVRSDSQAFLAIVNEVCRAQQKGRAFQIPFASAMLQRYRADGKAGSGLKQDIELSFWDASGRVQLPKQGFSIKSWSGNDPSIFNASKSSAFRFKIKDSDFNRAVVLSSQCHNKKGHYQLRRFFREADAKGILDLTVFPSVKSDTFRRNLELIGGTDVSVIVGLMLRYYLTGTEKRISQLLERLISENPLQYPDNDSEIFYRYRVGRFLRECVLGFTADRQWDGSESAGGGLILIGREWIDIPSEFGWLSAGSPEFESWLIELCYFETPSVSGPTIGKPYQDSNKSAYTDACLCIRMSNPFRE